WNRARFMPGAVICPASMCPDLPVTAWPIILGVHNAVHMSTDGAVGQVETNRSERLIMRMLIGRWVAVLAIVAGVGAGAGTLPAAAAAPHPTSTTASAHTRVRPAD